MRRRLTFQELRRLNEKRLPVSKNKRGWVVPHERKTLSSWCNDLAGEVGEVALNIKRFERGDWFPETVEEHWRELGYMMADVVMAVDVLAMKAGIDLGAAIVQKFNKKSRGMECPVLIDEDEWQG